MKFKLIALILVLVVALTLVYSIHFSSSPQKSVNQRIVSLSPSDTQILLSLGLGKEIVGMDQYSLSLLELVNGTGYVPKNLTVVSLPPNVSGIVLLRPTLVVGEEGILGNSVTQLQEAGLNLLLTNNDYAQNFSEIEGSVLNLSTGLGVKGEGENLVSWMNSKLSSYETHGNTTVAYLIWVCPNYEFYSAGGNVFINNILTLAGGVNVFGNYSGYPLLGPSSLILSDPQVILVQEMYNLSYTYYMVNHIPGIQGTKAYKDHRIYVLSRNLPTDLMNEPGPLSVYGVGLMSQILKGNAPSYVNTSYVMRELNVTMPVF
ncbi:ABC transporter substrate-binding protein [Metallosphaera tengchongensis]|uniref:ABC transporter substrate-binding protein n=1 Tax=Metallosphaera tengchongensis TaxID=1532350 RepID=A0A6N0NXI8_9CREN|nr:ABC transporter substrate-binding protein [Metallosphaera tengchongensis]QKR00583.1 ABC transporter substrate-binding protein [Metallosphaera tengchongensis]